MKFILCDNQEITRWAISELARQMGLCEEESILVTHNIYGLKKAVSEAENRQNEILVVLDYTQFNCTEDELLLLSLRFPYIHFILFSDQLSRNFLRRMIYGSTNFSVFFHAGSGAWAGSSTGTASSTGTGSASGRSFFSSAGSGFISSRPPGAGSGEAPRTRPRPWSSPGSGCG